MKAININRFTTTATVSEATEEKSMDTMQFCGVRTTIKFIFLFCMISPSTAVFFSFICFAGLTFPLYWSNKIRYQLVKAGKQDSERDRMFFQNSSLRNDSLESRDNDSHSRRNWICVCLCINFLPKSPYLSHLSFLRKFHGSSHFSPSLCGILFCLSSELMITFKLSSETYWKIPF